MWREPPSFARCLAACGCEGLAPSSPLLPWLTPTIRTQAMLVPLCMCGVRGCAPAWPQGRLSKPKPHIIITSPPPSTIIHAHHPSLPRTPSTTCTTTTGPTPHCPPRRAAGARERLVGTCSRKKERRSVSPSPLSAWYVSVLAVCLLRLLSPVHWQSSRFRRRVQAYRRETITA